MSFFFFRLQVNTLLKLQTGIFIKTEETSWRCNQTKSIFYLNIWYKGQKDNGQYFGRVEQLVQLLQSTNIFICLLTKPNTFNDTLEFFAKNYANYAYATGRQCSVGNKVTCAFVHVHSIPSHCEDIRQKNDQSLLYFLLINRIPTFIRAMRPRTLTVCCSAGRGENLFWNQRSLHLNFVPILTLISVHPLFWVV